MKPNIANILLLICLISIAFTQKQIDTFNILFPEAYKQSSGKSIELVTTQGGCFDWASSSPEVIKVTGLPGDQGNCYRKGVVQLKHVGSYPASVYITATNIATQQLSNIPVRIRPIARIQIIAKSKLMNINEIQDLSIFAYDKDHNMFTSLEGLKFEWQLVENSNILSKISLKNSHLILPLNERKNIESKGAESDILVIKGDSPGKAIVRVRCIEPGYEQLKHQIIVSVHQRFDIYPSLPTYIMVDSQFKFNLITPSRQQIVVPKSYYKTTLTSPQFKVTDTLQLQSPLIQDQAVLKVEDVRTVPPYSADVTIYAKEPNAIVLNVDEYLIVGEQTKVDVQFMWDKHLLHGRNSNYKIITALPFDVTKQTITGKQRTTGFIKATYKTLSTQKKVTVVLPLKQVLPSNKIVLPIEQTFEIKIVGGSGIYEYHIESDIATISGSGVISSRKEGQGKIVIVDKKVPRNKLVLDLIVSPVSSLLPLEAHKELNANEFGPIFTIGKTKGYEQFTKCNEQNIALETSHLPNFEISSNVSLSNSLDILNVKMTQSSVVKTTLMKNAILPLGIEDFVSKFATYIKAGDVSIEELRKYANELQNYGICSAHWVKSYQKYDDQMDVYFKRNINVRNKFGLRVYEKISNNVNKQSGDSFIMTPLASLDWRTLGGSYQWDTKTKTLLNSVEYHTEFPTVKCPQKQSVLEMRLLRTNVETNQLLLPVNQSKTIYVQCKHPSQLKIKYEKQSLYPNTINSFKGQVIKGQLVPYDNKGQIFYNSSNLIYEVEKTAGIVKINNDQFEFDSQSAMSAKVTFWTEKIAGLNSRFNKISTYFNYNVQQMFEISPHPQRNHLVTLFNPKTEYSFKLTKISDKAQVQCEGSISCLYLTSTQDLKVNTTRLGSGTMTIIDRSLYNYPSLIINFDVVDADEIVLTVSKSTVEVQKKLTAQIKLFYQKKLIPAWQYDFRNFLLVHEAGLRSRQILSSQASGQSNLYQISTQKPGVYKITAEQHYPRYLESSPITLNVYPKFQTNIPNLDHSYTKEDVLSLKGQLTVAVNCIRKIQLYGGPNLVSITHTIQKDNHVKVKFAGGDSKEIQIVGLYEGKTKVFLTVTSTAEKNLNIAVIELQITVKPIDHATIYSLEDAVLNAQFRVIPYLIVDGRVMIDSVCDFEYKWSSDGHIKLQGLNKKRLGVNATAILEGDALIKLQVLKNKEVIFTSTKEITVHKSLDIQLPTVIGHRQNAISTNLLLPQNSGLNFDSNIYVTKISECDENMLAINQNKLITSRQKGMVSIKLQKTNDNSYNNYMNVIVTQIKALFVENSYSQISAEIGKVTPVKFHVQDMYGRLFYNNLFNIEYDVISSNEDIFTVSIDPSKNFINVLPKKQGQANLILRLKSSEGTSNLGKLMEIPHDIVSVQVGKILEPQSPIYIAVGGQVQIQYGGRASQKWIILSGQKLIEIDPLSKKITGLSAGQAVISIGGHQAVVRILNVVLKQKIVKRPVPGRPTMISEYIATGKWNNEDILFQSLQSTYNHINNNLKLKCVPTNSKWFTVTSQIIKSENGQRLRCQTVMNYDFALEDQIPKNIEIRIVNVDRNSKQSDVYTSKEHISSTFWIPKTSRLIILSPEKPMIQFFIRTPQKLNINVIGGEQSWISEQFDASIATQVIQLNVKDKKTSNFDFKLKITHPIHDQTEEILVKYIIDESSRKAQQEAHKKEEIHPHETQEQQAESGESAVSKLFMGWHWTDFIILIMAINFILVLLWQACFNGQRKYHTL